MATGRVPTTANSPLTAKGDLFGYSTTQARVAVGNDGDTLVADSAATTGLRWQGNFAAGKNKLINGDFAINQRSFTSATTSGVYGHDRWIFNYQNGTCTYSNQTFTLGSAPVAGYEAIQFAQIATTGQSATNSYTLFDQRIEDVRTFAGQTVTVSFWARATSGTPSVAIELQQVFGSGGSPSSDVFTLAGKTAITTSWARYTMTATIPSIAGKTLGTTANSSFLTTRFWLSAGSDWNTRSGTLGIQNSTIQIWGVQLEPGSVATAFQTATGTLQGELAACQRYYQRSTPGSANQFIGHLGFAGSTSIIYFMFPNKVTMRTTPTAVDYANMSASPDGINTALSVSSIVTLGNGKDPDSVWLAANTSGATQYRPYMMYSTSSAGYLGVSAEL